MLLSQRDFRIVVACCMLIGLAVSFVLPFLSMFGTREVGMSLPGFGAFMTVSAITNIGISTVLSHHSDTSISRRTMLLIGSSAGTLGYLGYALVRDVWVLLFTAAVVLGVASITFSQLFAHARELLRRSEIAPSDAPLYMSAFRMCFALSWTVGPAIAAVTLRTLSFEGLFLGAALLHFLLFLVVLKFIPREPAGNRAIVDVLPLRGILAIPGVLGWFLAFSLVSAAHTISMSNMSLFVLSELGGTEPHVGVIFSLAPLFELPFMLYFGLLATRVDSSRLIRLAIALAVGYYGLLSLVRAPWHIYPLQLLSAAIVSVTAGVAISFFQDKLPSQPGAATNLYSNAMRIGSTSGFLLFGTTAAIFGYRGAYVVCAGLAVAALVLTSWASRVSTRDGAKLRVG
jgi:MFS transporter, SET family, sugar efflux transporter